MAKVSTRDAIRANILAAILLSFVAALWAASAVLKDNSATVLVPLKNSVADTLYKVGRYELLRDSAISCEKAFDQLVTSTLRDQIESDWTVTMLMLMAISVLAFNVWFLRGFQRDIEALRANSNSTRSPSASGQ